MNQFVKPTDAELEILHILWNNGANSVRFVNERLSETKEIVYTSTLKTMQVMLEKGLLTRDDSARQHIYAPALLDKFVENAFKGSAMQMVMQALGNHEASDAELNEIKALIEKLENK
jgi:BlaI family transcriptional regulator, penicillinase repressor